MEKEKETSQEPQKENKLKSTFIRFMYAMADLLVLNLLTLLCCLPVITLGPALTALYTVTLKIAKDEPVETVRGFFLAFKSNFKQGLVLGLIALFAAVVIYSDVIFAISVEGTVKIVFSLLTGVVIAIFLTYMNYVFALLAKFENRLTAHIRNAFLLAILSPGKTVMMWLIFACPVALMLLLPQYIVAYVGYLFILFGIAVPVYFNSRILNRIFDRFLSGEVEASEEKGT